MLRLLGLKSSYTSDTLFDLGHGDFISQNGHKSGTYLIGLCDD